MWKIKTTRTTLRPAHSHKQIYNLVFTLAMALGITPKKLAKFLKTEKIQKFAEEFSEALQKQQEKDNKKILDKLNKK